MRIGLSTPVVLQVPGAASAWERDADAGDLVRIAQVADQLGFEYLTCAEHVAVPVDESAQRGAAYWDPLATLSFLAARTTRIRLATSVLVLGYHHPLAIAKRYGTLDRLSGGRLILGVGVGSLRAEFDLLGAPFADRGERADDAVRALRASLSVSRPEYHGTYFRYGPMLVEPCAAQPRVPIWVGGRTRRSLRRAVELADGWMPFGLRDDELARLLAQTELPAGFEVVLSTGRAIDPIGDPSGSSDRLRRLQAAGATAITGVVGADSADHYCDQLAALRELAADVGENA
ncbi:LLM class F420-dependent oxidoreductase [Mycobacterium sp. pUA109]|uniref:LLM class F420-dependent oxidoreductase n=1 Tax=Mycobacterium sp. pUA109 TaxID=3238982 RepID=UPI00351AC882